MTIVLGISTLISLVLFFQVILTLGYYNGCRSREDYDRVDIIIKKRTQLVGLSFIITAVLLIIKIYISYEQ